MTKKNVTNIAAALGPLQHMRSGAGGPAGIRVSASPASLPIQGTAKRSHPDFVQLKAYVRKGTKREAMRKAEDQGHEDFSSLIQELLERYLRT